MSEHARSLSVKIEQSYGIKWRQGVALRSLPMVNHYSRNVIFFVAGLYAKLLFKNAGHLKKACRLAVDMFR